MASFYTLPSTVMHHPTHKAIKAAYSYYNVAKKTKLVDLMRSALIAARNVRKLNFHRSVRKRRFCALERKPQYYALECKMQFCALERKLYFSAQVREMRFYATKNFFPFWQMRLD